MSIMAAPKGNNFNPNGRPVGSENKSTRTAKEAIAAIIDRYFSDEDPRMSATEDFMSMDPKDRADMVAKFAQFILPRQTSVGVGIDADTKRTLSELFPFAPPSE